MVGANSLPHRISLTAKSPKKTDPSMEVGFFGEKGP
jgi:hypothetical protein